MNSRIVLFSLIFASASPHWAFADDATADAATDAARKLHDDGIALFEQHDYAGACAAFAAAYRLKHHFQIAGSLGDCEIQLGRNREAAEHLATFIREYPPGEPLERLEQAKGLLAKARTRVATLVFDVSTAGALVFIDGQSIGKAPIAGETFVEAGPHQIEAMVGLELVRQTVDVGAGEQRVVTLEARPLQKPAKQANSGEKQNTARWVMGLTGAAALASGGAGIGLLLAAESRTNAKNDLLNKLAADSGVSVSGVCGIGTQYGQECNQINGWVDTAPILNRAAIGAFALGAAAGAVSLGFAISSAKSSSRSKVETSAYITPTSIGFAMGGRF